MSFFLSLFRHCLGPLLLFVVVLPPLSFLLSIKSLTKSLLLLLALLFAVSLSSRHPLLVRYISASPPRQVAMVAIPTLSLLLVLAEWAGLVDCSPHLLLRPSPRERDAGAMMTFNIAVIHAGATVQAEAATAGSGGRVLYPGFGRVYGSLGESVVTQWGSANVIWLQVGYCLLHPMLIQPCLKEGHNNDHPLFILTPII